ASASPEASCAHNPVAPRTSSSCSRSVDRSRTGGPPHARSGPQCEPHAAPSNRDSRPSSPPPCRLKATGFRLPEFDSGATGRSGRFNEGFLLRRLQTFGSAADLLRSKLPDVTSCLVLDVRLPGVSGLDFQAELAKANIHIPIIFMTGHGD